MAEELTRAHVIVSGRVQGVFYRHSASQEAARLGLAGWVRNRDDGRVEAVFQGSRAAVEEIVAWCHQGPSHARVDAVDVRWDAPDPSLRGFDVAG